MIINRMILSDLEDVMIMGARVGTYDSILPEYNENKNNEVKRRCLDLIDYMLQIGVHRFESKLGDYK